MLEAFVMVNICRLFLDVRRICKGKILDAVPSC
jgi:hypothetical protein